MARLRIVLVEDGSFEHGTLRPVLESLDLDVVAEGADWNVLLDQADARSSDVFVVAAGSDPRLIHEMAAGDRAVVVVTDRLSDVETAPAAERGAFSFVPFPVNGVLLHAQIRAARARAADLARARKEADDLREQLETRKMVERAKGILMERLSLSEHDAFRKLQKASQDENRKMREIAESVIRAERMFGVKAEGEEPEAEPRSRTRTAS